MRESLALSNYIRISTSVRSPRHLNEMKASPAPRDVQGDERLHVALAGEAELQRDAVERRRQGAHKRVCSREDLNVDDDAERLSEFVGGGSAIEFVFDPLATGSRVEV